MINQENRLLDEINAWQARANAKQAVLERIAGIAHRAIRQSMDRSDADIGAWHSFALGEITGLLMSEVEQPWERFSE